MSKKKRRLFAVITAVAADKEQKEIIFGIIAQAQKQNIDIAVISNIYNPSETTSVLVMENSIYDLIRSDVYDGIILLSESFFNRDVVEQVNQCIAKTEIPVIAVGAALPEMTLPSYHFINTDDESDFTDITNHLIDTHGLTDIDFLSGHEFMPISHQRVAGYKKSLEAHEIPFDENKVHFGNFWLNSGAALAQQYISGELPFPQAVICANDHMAYGMLDAFKQHGISVPGQIAIIGYEHIHERLFHLPLLTTYERNRNALGKAAVQMLQQKIETGFWGDWIPPKGDIVHGNSCGCTASDNKMDKEMQSLQTKNLYDFVHLFNQLDHRLTESATLTEFTAVCRSFQYQVRNSAEIFFCLFEDWNNPVSTSDQLICYPVSAEEKPFSIHKQQLPVLFSGDAAAYYFSPLFFSNRSLGFSVLKFTEPDGYDHIYRNWLKSISTGLEVLRMKNDIQYLMQCQSLSETRDSLTKLRNRSGMERAYQAAVSAQTGELVFTALRICLFHDEFMDLDKRKRVSAILDATEAVKAFAGDESLCGRMDDNTFVVLMPGKTEALPLYSDKLTSFLIQQQQYLKNYGMNSFVCCTRTVQPEETFSQLYEKSCEILEQNQKQLRQKRAQLNYDLLLHTRNEIYRNPMQEFSIENVCKHYAYSVGHLRVMYKECFDISFHQDCICARISMAKNLLCLSDLSISEIAKRCGYHDNKYFFRQFQAVTGLSATRYRTIFQTV